MRCWYAVVSSKSSLYRIRVTRHSWPSPWRYGGLQPLLHLAMFPHRTDGPSPIQKAAAGIGIRGSRLILVARNGRSRRLDSADRIRVGPPGQGGSDSWESLRENSRVKSMLRQGSMHRSKFASLLDHLVGAGDERRWDFEAERPRGL